MSTIVNGNDWKDGIESVLERLKYLLESGHESDVEFLVGNEATGIESIKAHKFVLGTISSSVFDAQFRANEANGLPSDEPIKVIDVEPSAFKAMLKFLYSNDLSGINKENITDVLATAKKYLLSAFREKCVEMAYELLDVKNALGLLKVADLHDEKILVGHCRTFIDENIAKIVETDEFLLQNQEEITKLFARETLKSDELKLFKGLDRWAQKQCEDKEIENPTGEQKRAVIGSALNAIRFPLISPEEFTQQIVSTAILNKEEIVAVFLHKFGADENVKNAYPLPFSTYFRRPTNQWNEHDCSTNLTISGCGLVVTHAGPEKAINSVRATMPVPKMNLNSKKTSIAFYFEVLILKYQDNMEFGFCVGEFPLKDEWIGEKSNSVGIWSKEDVDIDGDNIDLGSDAGDFTERDMIGIGLIHSPANSLMQCFTTCNGTLLHKFDLPSKFVGLQLFPAATLNQKGDSIKANFGQEPWRYNPSQLIK